MTSKQQRYWIVFAALLLQAIPFGIAQNVPPLFIAPLQRTFHFSLSGIGYIFTFGALASSFAAPFLGRLFRSHKVKWIMLTGLILSAVGVILNAFATQLWMFYITSAITQVGTMMFSGLGIPYLIGTWFSGPDKAKALGIAFAGGSIGNFFLQPIVENLLAHHPIGRVYMIMGFASLIAGVVIVLALVHGRNDAEQAKSKDATAAAAKTATAAKNETSTPAQAAPAVDPAQLKGIGYSATLKLKQFWLLACSYAFIGLAVAALSAQYAAYFRDHLKLANTEIGIVGSVFAVSCLIGNLLGGWLFGKFGVVKAMSFAFVFQSLAVIAMLLGLPGGKLGLVAAFGWAALYGLNVFSYTSAPALIIQGLFGMKQSSEILGTFSIFFAVGFAIGNVIFGMFVDSLGYGVGWISVAIYTVIGYIGLLSFAGALSRKHYANVSAAPAQPAAA